MSSERTSQAGGRMNLRLLGGWRLTTSGHDVELGHREQRLAAVLALNGRRRRVHVAGVLWPDTTDSRALASLRRAVLHTQRRVPGLLHSDRTTIGLEPDVGTDLDELRQAFDLVSRVDGAGDPTSVMPLLTGDELLPGWYDDWAILARERIQRLRIRALERIASHALERGDLRLTIEAAGEVTLLEPLLESAREMAITAHLRRGDKGSAVREFRQYEQDLWTELRTPPSGAVLTLVKGLLGDSTHAARRGPVPALVPKAGRRDLTRDAGSRHR